jgi:hypothetical protein
MPETQVVDIQDPATDPLSDNSSESGQLEIDSQADSTAQVETDDPIQQVVEEFDAGGLPYKDLNSFVTGHKSLQTKNLRTEAELTTLRKQMQDMVPYLRSLRQDSTKKSVDDHLNSFVKDPEGMLSEFINKTSTEQLAPILRELAANRISTAANKFTESHKELSEEDELALEQILVTHPNLTNLGNNATIEDIENSLEIALAIHIKSDPIKYAEKLAFIKTKKEAGLESAKTAAGVGGKGGSIADGQATKDVFDDILTSEKKRQALYAR